MSVRSLLAELNENDITLSLKGDELVVQGKRRKLSPPLLALLRENKTALIELIRAGEYVGPRDRVVDIPPNRIAPGAEAITPEMLPLARLNAAEIKRIVSAVPGGAANVQDIYPLAPLQEGMLFHHLLVTEGDLYLTPSLLAFATRPLLDKFLQALQMVIDRHDILRTAVCWEGLSEPVQVVWRQAPLLVEEVSLDPPASDVAEELYARFDPHRYRVDIRQAPMMRVYIAEDAPKNRWVMMHLFHHLSIDHVAYDVLLEEIQAHLLGRAGRLPAPWPFRNFVAQARLGVSREEHEKFFRAMLGDVDEPTTPYGLSDVRGDGSGSREARREVDAGVAFRLRRASKRLEVTAASLCHLAWALVLARVSAPVSGRDDVVFGTVLFGRLQGVEGADRALGMLMNTLPIRIRLGSASVDESVREIHQSLMNLIGHEHASLVLAQRCSAVEAPTPLFSALLNYRYGAEVKAAMSAAGNTLPVWDGIEILRSDERKHYPLGLEVDDMDGGFLLGAQAQSPADPERLCEYVHTALEQLVETLEQAPMTAIRNLDVLPVAERHQLLVEWNDTGKSYSPDWWGHELIEEQAKRTPERIALIGEGQALSYGELNRRANQLGNYLQGLGVGPEVVVGLCIERSVDMASVALGTLKAGGAYLPLDPEAPLERLSYMLEDAGVGVVLTERKTEGRLPAFWGQTVCLDVEWESISEESDSEPISEVEGENLAYVIYTSGSTGRPKGVMVKHQGLCNLVEAQKEIFGLGGDARVLQFASLNFDASVSEIFTALAAGGSLYVYGRESLRAGDELVRALREDQITTVTLPPSVLAALGEVELNCLETVIAAGEASTTEVVERWAGGRKFLNAYGPTEATVCASVGECKAGAERRPSIGRPIKNTKLYILDRRMDPAPVGAQGDLYIAGVGLARGYVGRPELTAESFIPDRFNAEGGGLLYRTGDQVRYLVNGEVDFIGRADDQVKVRGYRIELGEIAAVLNEQPSVKQSVVVAREDEKGNKRLVGYVVAEEGAGLAELKARLRERLPEYMVPEAIVALEEMPLTANGKIDRKRLSSALTLRDANRQAEQEYGNPRTPLEGVVVGIFEELLGQNRVGIHDNFFEIGGHSLSAIQAITRIQDAFGVEIGVRRLFEAPTAESLSRRIEEAMRSGEKAQAPPLAPVEREAGGGRRAPLSFAQQRLWFIEQLNPGGAVYNIPEVVRLSGPLNLDALERAINEIVRRHEALRTRFEVESGEPAQVIEAWAPRSLEIIDLTGLPPEESAEEVGRRAREEAGSGFDLSRGPLFRVRILKLEEAEHVLLYTTHHIVSDGWSMEILIRELGTLYQSYLEGALTPLPELEIQYADFAVWQRKYLAGAALETEVGYWRKQLKDAVVLELPADRTRPAEPSYRGGLESIEIGGEVGEGLRRLSRREGVTLFMTLMAAFKALLMKYSGQEDISVGTAIANRMRKEVEGLIGFFVNTLVMRTDLSGNPSFRELLRREREVALGAYAHQEAPFEKLVEEINPERDLSRSPLFQVMMMLQHVRPETLELPGVKLSGVGASVEMAGAARFVKFDLTLSITDPGAELAAVMEYSLDLFEAGTIERLINHYKNVLEGVVKDSERPIWSLDLLREEERKQIVEEWNTTGADYPKDILIHELFETQVERNPHAIALIYEEQSLTYGELNARANRLAHYLRRIGVGPEVLTGILLERSAQQVVSLLAILKAGGAYLPLDPQYPPARLAFLLEDARLGALITDSVCSKALPLLVERMVRLDEMEEALAAESADNPQSRIESGNLCYVLYTSGSTGQPKGAMLTHRGVVNCLCWMQETYGLRGDDRFLFKTTLNFDPSVWEVCWPLWVGGSLVAAEVGRQADVDYLVKLMAEHEVTSVYFVPSMLRAWLAAEGLEGLVGLRRVICGGEAVSVEVVRGYYQRVGAELHHSYGPTETSIAATEWVCQADAERVVMGRPLGNVRLYVLDRWMNPAPVGVNGELYIGGEGVGRGYLNRREMTAERFAPDWLGLECGARLYRSGDVVRYRGSGAVEYVGRVDEQVKLRGYRIELGEVEAALRKCAGAREVAVALRSDSEGEGRLVGYVALEHTSEAPEGRELREYLQGQLPEYMIPSVFVFLDDLPLMANGKLDRRALPAPESMAYLRRGYEEPKGEIEAKIAQIWEGALKVERVGRQDNFFELGGHSLLVITIIERMRREGLNVDARTLFTAPTLQTLAEIINDNDEKVAPTPPNMIPAGCERITPEMLSLITLTQQEIDAIVDMTPGGAVNIQDIYPLAPLQEGILFHHLMNTEGDVYLLSNLLAFDTRERLERFVSALQAVIDRHDILRTAVVWEGLPEPAQVVWRKAFLNIEEAPLDPPLELEDGGVAGQLLKRFDPLRFRLDVRRAPLMRAFAAYDAIGERWLLLCLNHHLTIDHTTVDVLMAEAQAHLLGETERLPEPTPFRNFVAQAKLGVSHEEHEAFFREMLGDVDEPTAPFGLTDAQRDGSGIEEAQLELEMGLSGRLRERARMLKVSAASLCHLAWAMVLARVSGPMSKRDDVVFGTVLFGRMQGGEGADRTLGLFINTLPVKIHVGEEGVESGARRVHGLLAELIRHEHASLALAQKLSGVEAPAPLFSSLLNYRHNPRETETAHAEAVSAWTGVNLLNSEERTNYPVLLSIEDLGEGLALTAQTVADVDPRRVNELMRTALERLVEALETDPERSVREIDIIPEAELRQVIGEWNATEADYPKDKLIHDLFEAQAEIRPHAIALVHEEQSLTYIELNKRANRLAHHLRRLGVGPESLVGICMERGAEMVEALLATLKAGAAYLPLDPAYPPERLAYMLEDANPSVTLTQERFCGVLPDFSGEIVCLDRDNSPILEQSEENPPSLMTGEDPAYVIYTSGSTGQPKGVMGLHRGAINRFSWMWRTFPFTAGEVACQKTSLNFLDSLWEIFGPLLQGIRTVIIGDDALKDIHRFARILILT